MASTYFLKLGGSLITDKSSEEAPNRALISRLASEIADVLASGGGPSRLIIGHGSGSFGHVAASLYGTADGAISPADWLGFARVKDSAARLNRIVVAALLDASIPAVTVILSEVTSKISGNFEISQSHMIGRLLNNGLVPVIYGDAVIDNERGSAIASTEDFFLALSPLLDPSWILLAGKTEGVLDDEGVLMPAISAVDIRLQDQLRASEDTDVTGGMKSKVELVRAMVAAGYSTRAKIFSGAVPGRVGEALIDPDSLLGTEILL